MKEVLRGNYKVGTELEGTVGEERAQLEAEFGRKALSRLGGSICFVSKKAFSWTGESEQGEAQGGAGKEDRPIA